MTAIELKWNDCWDHFFDHSSAEVRNGYFYVHKRDDSHHASFHVCTWLIGPTGHGTYRKHIDYVDLGMHDSLSAAKAACASHHN